MLKPDHIGPYRLHNQRIAGTRCATPAEVVRWMGALQAQEYHQALWAIGVRLHAATVAAVEQAIADGQILRTWPMRGTLHFVPPDDVHWMLQLCATRILATDERRMRQLDLTTATLARCQTLVSNALSGGTRLTRAEMMAVLEHAGISTAGQRGYHILWYLAQSGVLCLGPMQGKQQTVVLLDEWVPHKRDLSRDEALAELTWRFFTSHGPATLADFARWTGLTITDARAGLQMCRDGLIRADSDGVTYWMPDTGASLVPDDATGVYVLPGFDEYVLGYKDRRAVLAVEHAQKIVPGNNGMFFPTLVRDGQIIGTWKRTLTRKTVDITISPFIASGAMDEQVLAATTRYSAFLGVPIGSLSIG